MPTSLVSTGVQFPDSTIQTTASTGVGANIQSFPASGTYTKPPGAKFVQVELWGAGGGGGRLGFTYVGCCPYPTSGGGGGGGAYSYRMFAAPEVGATVTVTVGAGGTGSTVPANSTNGGATTFGSLLFAGGGKLGINGITTGQQAGGGIAVNFPSPGNIQALPVPFSSSIAFYGTSCNAPIMAIWGGGPGGSILSPFGYPPSSCSTAVRRAISGYGSAFGGGGGGSGCVTGVFLATGGTGRLLGTNTFQNAPLAYVSNVVTGGGGFCGAGNSFNGGGGGGAAPAPSYAGKNGGIAGGGGGGGRAPSPTAPTSVGGNGGNGYAIVYTW